jgi:DNA helicase II / ATP-dependent DNA helicase PcrA
MRAAMKIEEFIKNAEAIFINGKTFDDERTSFIKNLNTCDLLAVPGSGKTTALIAKLYCIAQNMPFEDGSGILVLAHTNHAVDEIEKKLKRDCPQLFDYPNYIGTIQSFVNKFLADQACFERYGSYIKQNEDEAIEHLLSIKILSNKNCKVFGLLNSLIKSKYNILTKDYLLGKGVLHTDDFLEKLRTLKIIDKNYALQNIRASYDIILALPQEEKQIVFDFNKHIKTFCEDIAEFRSFIKEIILDDNNKCFYSDKFPVNWKKKLNFNTDSGAELKKFFEDLRSNGLLKYRDSFELANYFLTQHPQVKSILKNRFKFVFIDEMQDLEDYQIRIIDDIFFEENSKTVIQRIGDINQSIYSSGKKVKVECDWKPRCPVYLNNSHRLTNEIAKLVNCFTLNPQIGLNGKPRFKVEGLRVLDNPIKPHLFLFDKHTAGITIQNKFEDLIKSFNLDITDSGKKNGFKIIGWSTIWDNDEQKSDKDGNKKIRLKDLFWDYSKESKTKKEHFDCLKKYLQLYDQEKKTFESVRKSILNALVQVLRIEGINKAPNIVYRKSSLIEFVVNKGDEEYNSFKAKLFQWCFNLVIKKEFDEVYESVKQFIEDVFIKWNWTNEVEPKQRFIEKAKDFIDSSSYDFHKNQNSDTGNEAIITNPYNIEINSVHAVKGQTHCATMYVETSYHEYETRKLKVICRKATKTKPVVCLPYPLYLQEHAYRQNEDIRAKEALKMMYVGFSRPTHLLCFAALKDNIEDISYYDKAGWEIIDLTTPSIPSGITNDYIAEKKRTG